MSDSSEIKSHKNKIKWPCIVGFQTGWWKLFTADSNRRPNSESHSQSPAYIDRQKLSVTGSTQDILASAADAKRLENTSENVHSNTNIKQQLARGPTKII